MKGHQTLAQVEAEAGLSDVGWCMSPSPGAAGEPEAEAGVALCRGDISLARCVTPLPCGRWVRTPCSTATHPRCEAENSRILPT